MPRRCLSCEQRAFAEYKKTRQDQANGQEMGKSKGIPLILDPDGAEDQTGSEGNAQCDGQLRQLATHWPGQPPSPAADHEKPPTSSA